MAYEPTTWKNREVERPRTFTLQNNPDGTVTLIPAEGQVTEPGTPIVAGIMNKIETQLKATGDHIDNADLHVTKAFKEKIVMRDEGYISNADEITGMATRTLSSSGVNGPPIADGWTTILHASAFATNERAFQLGQKWNDSNGSLWYRRKDGDGWSTWNKIQTHPTNRLPNGQDFNNYGIAGTYAVSVNNLNGPSGDNGWGTLQVYTSVDAISQIFYGLLGTYERKFVSGSWESWKRMLTQSDYDQLFQSVSSGKAAIANAITQKGVPTAANAEFATMAANISNLSSVVKGSGTLTQNGQATASGVTANLYPKIVLIQFTNPANRGFAIFNVDWDGSETGVNCFMLGSSNGTWGNYSNTFSRWFGGWSINIGNAGATGAYNWIAI